MAGILFLILFVALGNLISVRLFRSYPWYLRAWIGSMLGVIGAMWAPVPFAFVFGFSYAAHILGTLLFGGISAAVWRFAPQSDETWLDNPKSVFFLALSLPFVGILCYLLTTHILVPSPDGFASGQSTFGDLPLHLGIATSIATQKVFPPQYSIFPGVPLSYPFLVDSLSSSLVLLGLPLRWAFLIPSYLLVTLLVMGFVLFAYELLKDRLATVLAAAFFFLNGGLGFSYFLDSVRTDPQGFSRIFTAFYQTPANYVDKNVVWANVICDMLVPQRTTLAGWAVFLLAIWLLYRAIIHKQRRDFCLAGIVMGLLPMIHTHSFLGLGLFALAWFVAYFPKTERREYFLNWLFFGGIALALALPQLFYWTFPQSTGGGFLKFHFDWANRGDPWLWFWIKNVGLVFILLGPALLSNVKRFGRLYSPALLVFLVADFVVFQPNDYDNNKLFYLWYMFSVIVVSAFLVDLYRRMEANLGRDLLLGMLIMAGVYSGSLCIGREINSRYVQFDRYGVAAAEFAAQHTAKDALFLTANFHNNPIAALAGRNILLGSPCFVYFHGLNYQDRATQIQTMFVDKGRFQELSRQYGVDYVYLSNYERDQFHVLPNYFQEYPQVYANEQVSIYAISERAKKELAP